MTRSHGPIGSGTKKEEVLKTVKWRSVKFMLKCGRKSSSVASSSCRSPEDSQIAWRQVHVEVLRKVR